MTRFRPKYITFDCYGTLTRFRMGEMAREIFADRVNAEQMDQFVRDFAAFASTKCSAHGSRIRKS